MKSTKPWIFENNTLTFQTKFQGFWVPETVLKGIRVFSVLFRKFFFFEFCEGKSQNYCFFLMLVVTNIVDKLRDEVACGDQNSYWNKTFADGLHEAFIHSLTIQYSQIYNCLKLRYYFRIFKVLLISTLIIWNICIRPFLY